MSVFDRLAGQEDVVVQLRAAVAAAHRMVAARREDGAAGARNGAASAGAGVAAAAGATTPATASAPESTPPSSGDTGAEMTHAWLFTGPPGSGRSIAARCFAAALQCESPDEPGCGECRACREVMENRHPDVTVVHPEGLTISVKEIRGIVARASAFPATGQWQVVIIEDADRLTEQAGNALLKAVEEPPAHTVFILCTPSDDPQDIMLTLRSRTRHIYVRMPSVQAVAQLLEREGANPDQASWAAAVSGAHIGRARALLQSEEARNRRRRVLELGQATAQPGRGYDIAVQMVRDARAAAATTNKTLSEQETEELRTALGAGGTGKGAAGALRGSAGVLKDLADAQKRRETRMVRDSVDLSLTDLVTFYRDALTQACGARVPVIHVDAQQVTENMARTFPPEALLRCIDAVMAARTEISQNVKPEVAVGGMVARISLALAASLHR